MAEPVAFQAAVEQFADWRWRLNNLYWITDKEGKRTLFRMNWAQESLFDGMHYLNVILKARQLGFTTFIQVFMLDACVFNADIRAGTIAHTLDDAKVIFRDKVKFPYDSLPEGIRHAVPILHDNATELMLGNNSSIRVGTSLRSGTLQYLHVSEYGKICAKFPEKAREVRTGALNTVQSGQIVFIESTAEGQEGHFYEVCDNAQSKQRAGARLTPLDFRFHFFPWWKCPEYEIDADGVVIGDDLRRYFEKLRDSHGIELSAGQQAWYAKKAETQLADMKREYPSTPGEAFEASVEGAYYADQLAAAELQGRIGAFPPHDGLPVHTVWDIGYGDYTAIWFFQVAPAAPRLVGFYQNCGEGMPHYVDELRRIQQERGWKYGNHYLPHDAMAHEWSTGRTRWEQFKEALKVVPKLVPQEEVADGINAARHILGRSEFDEGPCSEGIKCLKNYRKEWDDERSVWKDKPRHDWASHGADAFRYFALAMKELKPTPPPKPLSKHEFEAHTAPGKFLIKSNLSIPELLERQKRRRENA